MQSVILGTAQWGLDYGATNVAGRLSDASLDAVVRRAVALGIDRLDTAPAYGDAESRIGRFGSGFSVQTKVLAQSQDAEGICSSLEGSLGRLGCSSVAAVLVHDWAVVPSSERARVASTLEDCRDAGLCSAVGVSAYEESEVEAALNCFSCLDVVQVPASVLDQRLVGSKVVGDARKAGTRVQARSVFLQGAALAGAEHPMFGAHPDLVRLRSAGVSSLAACLGWVSAQEWIDDIVLGVASADELESLMAVLGGDLPALSWPSFASSDPWLIDPRLWTAPTRA